MHGVKIYGIKGKEVPMGDWEEISKETCNIYDVCLQNNFKVYFCTQIYTNKTAYVYICPKIFA